MKEGHPHIKDMDWAARGEIKDSLEESCEGDETAAAVAKRNGPVDG